MPNGENKLQNDKLVPVLKNINNSIVTNNTECGSSKSAQNDCAFKIVAEGLVSGLDDEKLYINNNIVGDGEKNHLDTNSGSATPNSFDTKEIRRKRDINNNKDVVKSETEDKFQRNNLTNVPSNEKSNSDLLGDNSYQNYELVKESSSDTNRRIFQREIPKNAPKSTKNSKPRNKSRKLKKQKNRNVQQSKRSETKRQKSMYVLSPINSTGKKYKIVSSSNLPKLKLQNAQGSSTRQNHQPISDDQFDYIENLRQKNANSIKNKPFEFPNLNHDIFNFGNIEENTDEMKKDSSQESEGPVPGIIDVHHEPDMDHEYVPINGKDGEDNKNFNQEENDQEDDYKDLEVKNYENNEEENENEEENQYDDNDEDDYNDLGKSQSHSNEGVEGESSNKNEEDDEESTNTEEKEQPSENNTYDTESIKERERHPTFSPINDQSHKYYKNVHSNDPHTNHPSKSQSKLKYIPSTHPHINPEHSQHSNYPAGNTDNAKQAFVHHPMSGSGNTKGFNHDFKPMRSGNPLKGPSGVQPPNRFQTVENFNKSLIRKPLITNVNTGKPTTPINLSGYGGYKPHVAPLVTPSTVTPYNNYDGRNNDNPYKETTQQYQHHNGKEEEEEEDDYRNIPKETSYDYEEGHRQEHPNTQEDDYYDNRYYDKDSRENFDYNENPEPVTYYNENNGEQYYDQPRPTTVSNPERPYEDHENINTFTKYPTSNADNGRVPVNHETLNVRPYYNDIHPTPNIDSQRVPNQHESINGSPYGNINPTPNRHNERIPVHHKTINGRPFDNRPINNLPKETPLHSFSPNHQNSPESAVSYYDERRPYKNTERPFTHDKGFSPFFRESSIDLQPFNNHNSKYNTAHNNEYVYPVPTNNNEEHNNYDKAVSYAKFSNDKKPFSGDGSINLNHYTEHIWNNNKPNNIISSDFRSGQVHASPYKISGNIKKPITHFQLQENSITRPSINLQNVQTEQNLKYQIRPNTNNVHIPSNNNINYDNLNNYYNNHRFEKRHPPPGIILPYELNYTIGSKREPIDVYNSETRKNVPYIHESVTNGYPNIRLINGNKTPIDPRNEDKNGNKNVIPYQTDHLRNDKQNNVNSQILNTNEEYNKDTSYKNVQNGVGNGPLINYNVHDSYSYPTRPHYLHSPQTDLFPQSKLVSGIEREISSTPTKMHREKQIPVNDGVNERVNPHTRIQHKYGGMINNNDNYENQRDGNTEHSKLRNERLNFSDNYTFNNNFEEKKFIKDNPNMGKEDGTKSSKNENYDYNDNGSHKTQARGETKNEHPERIPLSKKSLVKTLNNILDKKDAISRVKDIDEHKDKPQTYNNFWVLEYSVPTEK